MNEPKTYTQEVKELNVMVEKLSKDISDIKKALLGNEFGEVGLVKKVLTNQEELEVLKKFKDRIIWTSMGVSMGTGGIVALIIEYLIK